jgi:hypothetical protein
MDSPASQDCRFDLTSSDGKRVGAFYLKTGEAGLVIPVADYPAGTYMLHRSGSTEWARVVILP